MDTLPTEIYDRSSTWTPGKSMSKDKDKKKSSSSSSRRRRRRRRKTKPMKDKEKYTDISTCLVRLSTEFCLLANLVNLSASGAQANGKSAFP
uniref:pH-response regulator protein palA/RIM20 n=1 Tax=Talaromyces marneffei PM1 TaxID=1077442 RepID=A0A093V488_TALMA